MSQKHTDLEMPARRTYNARNLLGTMLNVLSVLGVPGRATARLVHTSKMAVVTRHHVSKKIDNKNFWEKFITPASFKSLCHKDSKLYKLVT